MKEKHDKRTRKNCILFCIRCKIRILYRL